MKIAILYSGYLRGFSDVKLNHIEFLHCLSEDIRSFVHTWHLLGDALMDGRFKGKKTISVINDLFHPTRNTVSLEVTKHMHAERFKKYVTDRSPQRVNSMFYSNYKAFELTKEDPYDLFIKCRGDIKFLEHLDPEMIKRSIDEQVLVTPNFGSYHGVNDQFCYGPRAPMKAFCSVFNHLDDLATQVEYKPELLTMQNLKNNNISVLTDEKVKYVINRGDGAVFDNSGFK